MLNSLKRVVVPGPFSRSLFKVPDQTKEYLIKRNRPVIFSHHLLGLFHGQTLIIRNKKINIKNNLLPRALFLFDIGTVENIQILILGRCPNTKKE